MGKQRNLEVEEYLRRFIVERLENTEAFVNTFGKDFARKRLTLNLSAVYTNEEMTINSGYQSMEDHSITLCYEGENGSLLSAKDIQDNDIIKATALHEGVHSILEKLKRECRKLKIKSGSGVLEIYKNEEELGRGFNEGLTNWIVEKAGIKTGSYKYLTNAVKQIELAIGQEETMAIGKGNIKKNVCKRLMMSDGECKGFLAHLDYIYVLEGQERELAYIKKVSMDIKEEVSENLFPTEEERRKEKLLRAQRFNEIAPKIKADKEYQSYLTENNLEDTLDASIEYYSNKIEDITCEEMNLKLYLENVIFDKYFKKEFAEIIKKDEITDEELEKYMTLRKHMLVNDEEQNTNASEFKKYMGSLAEKRINRIKEKAEAGELSIQEYIKVRKILKEGGYFGLGRSVAEVMNKEEPSGITFLIDKLEKKRRLGKYK